MTVHHARAIARRSIPVLLVASVAGIPAGAAPVDDESASPVHGELWQALDPPFEPVEAVAVGEQLWIARSVTGHIGDAPAFAVTIDGASWELHDLAALGLPTDTTLDVPGALVGTSALGAWDGHLHALVAALPQPGVSTEGVGADLWVVTTDGAPAGGLRLVAPAETGLDQRLEGPGSYRITTLGAPIAGTERPAFTAIGQFWTPYATSGADFAVIELGDDGGWSVSNHDFPDGPLSDTAWGATIAGTTIAVTATGGTHEQLARWTRTESGWRVERGPLLPDDRIDQGVVDGAAASPDRIVAVGRVETGPLLADQRPVAWSTPDGATWSSVELPGGDVTANRHIDVVWTGAAFVAASDRSGPVWSSPDGAEWTIVGSGQARRLTLWNGRVVALGDGLRVSPPLVEVASPAEITAGETVAGELISGVRDRWTFDGDVGSTVTIRLTSDAFDPYLELLGPDGAVLAADDDGGGGLNAMIADLPLPAAGTYTVVAGGYDDTSSGPYQLALQVG